MRCFPSLKELLRNSQASTPGMLTLLALPTFTRNKLILIDDIERKHKSFEADELLGFINEFSEKYSTRFLLEKRTGQGISSGLPMVPELLKGKITGFPQAHRTALL
uniref:Uncharacterized protein n=1 Tax=Rhizophagus irregularis (strain DAOM 181602 / DAOM 197198 / MUCL 43194) TaxID=747089 RepID=U9TN23_RHIID